MGRRNKNKNPLLFSYSTDTRAFKNVKTGIKKLWKQDSNKIGRGNDAMGRHVKEIRITKVERLDNCPLGQQYASVRTKMIEKYPSGCEKSLESIGKVETSIIKNPSKGRRCKLRENVNEVYLFHGCSFDAAEGIKQDGFENAFSNKK